MKLTRYSIAAVVALSGLIMLGRGLSAEHWALGVAGVLLFWAGLMVHHKTQKA